MKLVELHDTEVKDDFINTLNSIIENYALINSFSIVVKGRLEGDTQSTLATGFKGDTVDLLGTIEILKEDIKSFYLYGYEEEE